MCGHWTALGSWTLSNHCMRFGYFQRIGWTDMLRQIHQVGCLTKSNDLTNETATYSTIHGVTDIIGLGWPEAALLIG